MPIHREFLDWRQPALTAAADYFLARFRHPDEFDLGHVIVVVPGARAGRRLLEILVALSDEKQLVFTPPAFVTPDKFPELLYQPKLKFADGLTQLLAWIAALRALPPPRLAPFLPFPPEPPNTLQWLAVAETLRKLHLELAADGLDCQEVLEAAGAVEGFAEHERWQALCDLERAYLDTLDRLKFWDVQTARLVAIQKREIGTDQQIVLLGMADLNRAQRLMLDQIADRVTALIVAPPEYAERFDEHGCLLPAQWTEAELPLVDEHIERVDGPADQAEAVTRWLAWLGGRYRADQIVVGLGDEKLVPQIDRQLAQCGVALRFAEPKTMEETGPYRLLKIAADYTARGRFRDLAALVRHPDVFDWLLNRLTKPGSQPPEILTTLDRFARDHFPARLSDERLAKDEAAADVLAIHRCVAQLVTTLTGKPQPLGTWADRIRDVLSVVYGGRELDRRGPADRNLLRALQYLRAALDALANVPEAMQPTVDARQACQIVLDQVAKEPLPPPPNPDAIEMLGWLELPLDDAPALIVTTFNEGWIPSSTTADAFLPNRLRQALGLLDNDRRLARDAYALSVLLASRKELRLIVAHRDLDGNPLPPSRLLFATDADRAVARAQRFFGDLPPAPPRRNQLTPTGGPRPVSLLVPPKPQRLKEPLKELSVTRFREYIACPYRFYLRHVLALEALADEAAEFDGAAFGELVHLVLEQFGRSADGENVRATPNPDEIVKFLDYQLDRIAGARYGHKHARSAVLVQIEQVRLRLRAFARWQAERTRQGWRIVFSEDSENRERMLTTDFTVDGEPFTLCGRIDRIDYLEGQRKLCVLDYKTADRGDGPQRTHRRGEEWIDLQLPLYRHLVRAAKLAVDFPAKPVVELGYIVLPRDLTAVGLELAAWDEATLESADVKAREIIRAIRAEKFWPPQAPPDFSDDLAVICQDRRMGSWQVGQEGDAA